MYAIRSYYAGEHPVNADQDGVILLFRGDQQRPQVLVPAVDELDDEHRGDRRPGHRQQDAPEELHRRGPVYLGGLGYLARDLHEELPEQEHRGRRHDSYNFV